jgi:hypothetical protein
MPLLQRLQHTLVVGEIEVVWDLRRAIDGAGCCDPG